MTDWTKIRDTLMKCIHNRTLPPGTYVVTFVIDGEPTTDNVEIRYDTHDVSVGTSKPIIIDESKTKFIIVGSKADHISTGLIDNMLKHKLIDESDIVKTISREKSITHRGDHQSYSSSFSSNKRLDGRRWK